MSDSYDVYHPDAGPRMAAWHVLVEYSNQGQKKPPTVLGWPAGPFLTKEDALVAAEEQARTFDPPDPFSPQGRKVYRDGEGFLTVIEGAMSTFHFSTRAVCFLDEL